MFYTKMQLCLKGCNNAFTKYVLEGLVEIITSYVFLRSMFP